MSDIDNTTEDSQMIYLADDKQTKYVIVYRKDHSLSEQTAVEELQKYLNMITGAEFPIVTDDTPKADHEIVVGFCDRPGCKAQKKLGTDGFTIKTDKERLLLLGSEVRGALYAVYTFLETYCGCRFFTANCEKIPTVERTLYIDSNIDDTQIPVFEYRNVYWGTMDDEMICAKLKNNGGMGHEITDKVGGAIHYNGSFCHTIPVLAETFNHWDMPCLCDEDIYQTTLKNVKADLRAHPDQKIISVSQVDGLNGECSCEKCRKVYEEEKSHMGTLLRFVNRIQEDIKDEFPDCVVDTLAYRYTRKPPAVTKPHKDMIVRLCNIECCFRHPLEDMCYGHDEEFDSFPENLKQWNAISNRLYIWDYTTNFANMSTLFPNFEAIRPNMRFFADNGVVGMFSQGNITQQNGNGELGELRAYLLAKLQWNPYMGESEYRLHMQEFCENYYGEAGKYILEFINLIHDNSQDAHMTIYFDSSADKISLKGYKDKLAGCFAFYDKASELFDKAEADTWGAGNKFAYTNVRRTRISLHNYYNFVLKSARDGASPEMDEMIQRLVVENNREQYTIMRELNVFENREFNRIDFSHTQDLHTYALWWN